MRICERRRQSAARDIEPEQIYLAKTEETSNWDFDGFAYEESEGYSLLYPL